MVVHPSGSSRTHHHKHRKHPILSAVSLSRALPLIVTVLTGFMLLMRNTPSLLTGLNISFSYSTYDLARLLNITAILDPAYTSAKSQVYTFPDTLAHRYVVPSSSSSSSPSSSPQRHCTLRPFPSHLHKLLSDYSRQHISNDTGSDPITGAGGDYGNFASDLRLVSQDRVATVQVCIGHCEKLADDDDYYDDHFVHRIRIYTRGFRTVVVVPSFSMYSDPSSPSSPFYYSSEKQIRNHPLVQRALTSLKTRRRIKIVIASMQSVHNPDARVALLYSARHPILHRGGEAALVALAISGRPTNGTVKIFDRPAATADGVNPAINVSKSRLNPQAFTDGFFATEALRPYLRIDFFLHATFHKIRGTKRVRRDLEILGDGMGPIHESCCRFHPYGLGDGAKILCLDALGKHALPTGSTNGVKISESEGFEPNPIAEKNDISLSTTVDCWILSVGCGGRWSFEADIILNTACAVHVFDCTGNFTVPQRLKHRVRHDKLCVGPLGADRSEGFRTWPELLAIGAQQAGLPKDTPPLAVKMDVEGWEFPVLHALTRDVKDRNTLPRQIVLEVHTYTAHPVGAPYKLSTEKKGRYEVDTSDVAQLFVNLSSAGFKLVHRADNPFCGHCSEVTLLHDDAFPLYCKSIESKFSLSLRPLH